ncbi:MAG: 2-hydroxychromene-2-carboxylate isomerase, partial [Gammaproteobacteria bacterium]|nr:2-hydroxychromene-2-carboxylate isomerase [Gammaproteobacteria bacterium]
MTEAVDVYWSFRSPYSYLATPDMLALADEYDIAVNLRVVLPIAVRAPDFFSPENARRGRYIQLDWPRRAEFLGMPNFWPSPDPIVQDLKTFEISAEQPYIYRLSKLGVEAQRRGKGVELAARVSSLLFGGTKDWHLGDHLGEACARAGLSLADME